MVLRRPLHCCCRVVELKLQLRDKVVGSRNGFGHPGLQFVYPAASAVELLKETDELQRD